MNPIDTISRITWAVTAQTLRRIADAMDAPIVKDPFDGVGPIEVRVANVDELADAIRARRIFARAEK